jgi:hypothetical protein
MELIYKGSRLYRQMLSGMVSSFCHLWIKNQITIRRRGEMLVKCGKVPSFLSFVTRFFGVT